MKEMYDSSSKKITWINILNAVIQAIIAALTALGVSLCASAIAIMLNV